MAELTAGQPAPEFSLSDQDGKPVNLSQFRGRPVVVFFYPKDDSPGCILEVCRFRDNYPAILAKQGVVLGISADTAASHRAFSDKFDLPYQLLADPDNTAITAYGAWGVKNMYGKIFEGILRHIYVIDQAGIIKKIFRRVLPDTIEQSLLLYL